MMSLYPRQAEYYTAIAAIDPCSVVASWRERYALLTRWRTRHHVVHLNRPLGNRASGDLRDRTQNYM
eukprot:6187668-Pleurochrysis_carterae.AAC.6